jgi:hypothetical protein
MPRQASLMQATDPANAEPGLMPQQASPDGNGIVRAAAARPDCNTHRRGRKRALMPRQASPDGDDFHSRTGTSP